MKQLKLFPEIKATEKKTEKAPSNINEYFLNEAKTNPLDRLPAAVAENYNKYDAEDGENIVVGPNNQLMMESELKQQSTKQKLKMSSVKRPLTRGMNDWDAIKVTSKNNPAEMKEVKKTLFKHYNEHGSKFMSDDDLKIIKRGKYSEFPKLNIKPMTPIAPVPKEPEIPLEIKIKQLADARLKAKQDLWDKEHGQFGLSNLMRPK